MGVNPNHFLLHHSRPSLNIWISSCSIVVRGQGCSISKLISMLRGCSSFHLFHEKFADISIDLETPRETIKKFRQDLLLDKLQLVDVVSNLVEEWAARKGSEATLQELMGIFKDNNLTDCYEALKKDFDDSADIPKEFRKYSRVPPGLTDFLSGTSKLKTICIIPTIDVSITCQKLRENQEGCIIHGHDDFLKIISVLPPSGDQDPLLYATIDSLKQLKKILTEILDQPGKKIRLAALTPQDNQDGFMDLLQSHPNWEQAVAVCVDPMGWNDLTLEYKNEIEKSLKERFHIDQDDAEDDDDDEKMDDGLRGQLLADLINEIDFPLFKDTLPEEPNYYVGRKILARHYISPKIFDQESSDIFLFNGINRYELSCLVKKLTAMSSAQIQKSRLNVKHIILEHPSHFDKICEKTYYPVHLLQFENGRLKWTRSRGKVATLQNNLEEDQECWIESEFCAKLEADSNMPVIIADSPGMGKSVLLAKIGKLLTSKFPERHVFFIPVTEFIRQFKAAKIEEKEEGIRTCLQSMLCENEVGKLILAFKLNASKGILVELLMDGFDELNHVDSKLARKILKTTSKSFKSIRLWVTSRQHLLSKLENSIGTLGYNIQPFDKEDQVQFLTSYWSRDTKSSQEKLTEFANLCLTALKSNMNSKQQDIAGIPLQCLLIGEVYEDDALTYANPDHDHNQIPPISISSITDLYTAMVAKKLKKFRDINEMSSKPETLEDDTLLKIHVRLSLELIFPEHASKFQHLLHPARLEDILKVGILESTSSTTTPRFIHRTFAEYLVAWSFVHPMEDDLTEVFSEGVFSCHDILDMLSFLDDTGLESFSFTHPVVCYFIDSLMKNTFTIPLSEHLQFADSMNSEASMRKIAHACVNADLVNIFQFFLEAKIFEKYESKIFDEYLLVLAIYKSSIDVVQTVLGLFEKHQDFEFEMKMASLFVAVRRGDFSIVEYLINDKELRSIVEEITDGTKIFLHACVADSRNDTAAVTDQKIEAIRMIIQINPKLLEETSEDGRTPLHSKRMHVRLMTELILLGSNVLAKDSKNNTVLHIRHGWRTLSREDIHIVLASISDDNLKILVHMKGKHGNTPLASLLQETDPVPETLTRFKELGADFNYVDGDGNAVLEVAIKHGRKRATLLKLIECGALANGRRAAKNKTVLHIAAWFGNLDAALLLLGDEQSMDVNIEDDDGLTPLDYALKSDFQHGNRLATGMALHKAGGKFKGIVNSTGQTWLHLSVQSGNIQSIQLLLKLGIDVNQSDEEGNKPLHLLPMSRDPFKAPILELLLDHEADPNVMNTKGETPFHIALMSDQSHADIETFKLLKSKTNIKWTPSLANRGLNILIIRGDYLIYDEVNEFAKEMEDHGADYSFRDDDGNSQLHMAITHFNYYAFTLLLDKQGDVNVRNNLLKTPLHMAAVAGILRVRHLIEKGGDVHAKDKFNKTFLHYFILSQRASDINALVKYLATKKLINVFNINGGEYDLTPLQLAIYNFELEEETLSVLHSDGADFNAVDNTGESVLGYAVRGQRSVQFLSSLIRYGADWKGASLLHWSARYGSLESLKFFLDLRGLDVNGFDEYGNTPTHYAAALKKKEDALEACKTLIQSGADVNILNANGKTPIQYARVNRADGVPEEIRLLMFGDHSPTSQVLLENNDQDIISLETIQCLTERGDNIFDKDAKNYTILHKFVMQSKTPTPSQFHSVCEYLVGKNISDILNTPGGRYGATPFQEAVKNLEPDAKTLSLLKSNKAIFDAVDNMGESLLFYSVRGKRSTDFLKTLVNEFGADTAQLNNNKNSILHIGIQYGTADNFEFLIGHVNLTIDCKNRDGNTPLHWLVTFADENIEAMTKYRLLVRYGVNLDSSNSVHKTPLHCANDNKNKSMSLKLVKCLIDDGADVYARDMDNRTFLHRYILNLPRPTPSEFHDMVKCLHGQRLVQLFNEKDGKGVAPIHHALLCLELEERSLSMLHSDGISFNDVDNDGWSALRYAVLGGRSIELLSCLITKFGADLTIIPSGGVSFLHFVACEGTLDALKFVTDLGELDINGRNEYGSTPLISTLNPDSLTIDVLEKCKLLISKGTDVNIPYNRGHTPLSLAMVSYDESDREELISCLQSPALTNCFPAGTDNPLHISTISGKKSLSLELIKQLIADGADVHARDKGNATFLHCYIINDPKPTPSEFHDVVEYLHGNGKIDIFNEKDNEGATPLHLAVQHLEPEERTFSKLHMSKVNFNTVDTDGWSVLAYAVLGKRITDLLSNLITKFGADYKKLTHIDESLLHVAARYGTADALTFLADLRDLNINGRDRLGRTPLACAADQRLNKIEALEKCKLLVSKGADVNIACVDGYTPLKLVMAFTLERTRMN